MSEAHSDQRGWVSLCSAVNAAGGSKGWLNLHLILCWYYYSGVFFFSEQLKRMACFSLDVIQIRSILRDANGRERIFSCIPIIKMASWVSTCDFISWRHLLILTLQWCFELHVTGQSYFLSLKLQTQNSHIENFVRKIHIEQAMGMKWLCIPTVITVVVIIECL